MATRDVCMFINEMDDATVQAFIKRFEFRGKDATFAAMRDEYLARLPLHPGAHALDLGCGTGVVTRPLARRVGNGGRVLGIDQSSVMIAAARGFAEDEGITEGIEFVVGDIHTLDYPDATFDAITAHTVFSHVADPLRILKEAARVLKPGGMIAIFDGDYASWTWAHPDPLLARTMDEALVATIVNAPRILRDMPRLLHQAGLQIAETFAHVFREIGTGGFFLTAAESYGPMFVRAGHVSEEQAEAWLAEQRRGAERGTFFAACNYYTYLTRHAAGD